MFLKDQYSPREAHPMGIYSREILFGIFMGTWMSILYLIIYRLQRNQYKLHIVISQLAAIIYVILGFYNYDQLPQNYSWPSIIIQESLIILNKFSGVLTTGLFFLTSSYYYMGHIIWISLVSLEFLLSSSDYLLVLKDFT